jgi:hypothetical protein
MKNPFPGMNPYLEQRWDGVHSRLLIYIADQLQERLPADLVARTEEQLAIEEGRDQKGSLRPDVKIMEPGELREPAAVYGEEAIAEPVLVMLEPEVDRWGEIREAGGRLVTVIEVLSPTNKSGEGQIAYRRRQRAHISGGVNLVEGDLLRKGEHVLAAPLSNIPDWEAKPYRVCVFRAAQPDQAVVYAFGLREPLRPFRVPLRPKDKDVLLHLHPLVDQCFERGGYWALDYRRELKPTLTPEDAAWMDELLRKSGLRA